MFYEAYKKAGLTWPSYDWLLVKSWKFLTAEIVGLAEFDWELIEPDMEPVSKGARNTQEDLRPSAQSIIIKLA